MTFLANLKDSTYAYPPLCLNVRAIFCLSLFFVICFGVGGFKESATCFLKPNDTKVTLFFGFAMDFVIFFRNFYRSPKLWKTGNSVTYIVLI